MAKERAVPNEAHELRRIFAANVKLLAKNAELPIADLARAANISRSHLCEVLAGRSRCTLDWLAQIAAVFMVDPAILLTEVLSPDAEADTE